MKYEHVKAYLTTIGAELLTEDKFAERWRAVMGDEPYLHPFGCLGCGRANGGHNFRDVLFAIYPDEMPVEEDMELNPQTLGVSGPTGLKFTLLGRCKFCGESNILPDY